MALSNAEKQRRYRKRVKQQGLIQMNSYIDADTSRIIDRLATRLNAPRYAVVEYAIKRLAEVYEQKDRLNQV
jgi:hypothetical protein